MMQRTLSISSSIARRSRCLSMTKTLLATAAPQNPAGVFHKSDFTSQDPYPLSGRTDPKSMVDDGSLAMGEDLKPHAPIDRSHETTETKRARLLWQSRKRGILETDLLLSTFAAKELENMNMDELILYDQLLDEPDWEIYYYATTKKQAPAKFQGTKLIDQLIQHVKNEEKATRIMPNLKDQSANYRADKATDNMRTTQGKMGDKEAPKTNRGGNEGEKRKNSEKPELKEKLKEEDGDPATIAS